MKLKSLFLGLWFCLLVMSGYAQVGKLTKVPINTRNANMKGYVEYLPVNYVSNGSKKYPVLYWLHGLGETGDGSSTSLDILLSRQIGNWLKTHNVDFIVLIPQDGSGYWNGATNGIRNFVDWANTYYGNVIDPKQQHMAGLSAGGYGIRDFIIGNTATYKAFATFTPMSTNLNSAVSKVQQIVDNKQYVWIHQGTADVSPNTIATVTAFHTALYKLDATRSRMTAYTGLGHSAWEKVYNGNGRTTAQTTGTVSGVTYYNWTMSDPNVDWFGWLKAHPKQTSSPVVTAPTTIALSNTEIPDNNVTNTVVGSLTSDGTQTVALQLVSGSLDNSKFKIESNVLKVSAPIDFSAKPTYKVEVEAGNSAGSVRKTFSVVSSDDIPSMILLSNTSISSSSPIGSFIGTLSADGTQPTFKLVAGSGDNSSFLIDGNELLVNAVLNFSGKPTYTVEVEATNGAGSIKQTFSITSSDVPAAAFTMYPNPLVGSTLYVAANGADVYFTNIIVINNANGYQLKRFVNVPANVGTPLELDFSDIPAGSYTLKIWRKNATVESIQIIKN